MAKNKIENHGKIIEAAYNEFLEYGFVDAHLFYIIVKYIYDILYL